MSRGVNTVILIGNLGSDPNFREFPSKDGKGTVKRCTFSIATNESHKNKEGEIIEHTEWHRIVTWTSLAQSCYKNLHKGDQIYVEGKLRTRTLEDQNGQKKYITEVVARDIQFLNLNRNRNRNKPEEEPQTSSES